MPRVEGFEVLRQAGPSTWEARELALDRRVLLHLVPDRRNFDASDWANRVGSPEVFSLVETSSGLFMVTRFVPDSTSGGRRWWVLLALVLVTAAGLVVWTMAEPADAPTTALAQAPAGAVSYGSSFGDGEVSTVDCLGKPVTSSSPACTITMLELGGEPVVAQSETAGPWAGTARQWLVRGVRGRVQLQVLIARGDKFIESAHSESVEIARSDQVHVFHTELPVPQGARFALRVSPGSGVGVRTDVSTAATALFLGPAVPLEATAPAEIQLGRELMLRVDVSR